MGTINFGKAVLLWGDPIPFSNVDISCLILNLVPNESSLPFRLNCGLIILFFTFVDQFLLIFFWGGGYKGDAFFYMHIALLVAISAVNLDNFPSADFHIFMKLIWILFLNIEWVHTFNDVSSDLDCIASFSLRFYKVDCTHNSSVFIA